MSASLFSVSSHDYIRLTASGSLDFFSEFSCFHCNSRLWRNGYRQRCRPVLIKLVRLKCRNPKCNCHYTVYPSDVLPRYRYHPETISSLTAPCLKTPSSIEAALRVYQHAREHRIDEGETAGPDVSTLRRWIKSLADLASFLSLVLSARKRLPAAASRLITVVLLTASLTTQLLTGFFAEQKVLSPKVPVTDPQNQANDGVSSQKDLDFYNQEHPP